MWGACHGNCFDKLYETDVLDFSFVLAVVSISLIVTGRWPWIYSVRTASEDKVDMEQLLDTTFYWFSFFLLSIHFVLFVSCLSLLIISFEHISHFEKIVRDFYYFFFTITDKCIVQDREGPVCFFNLTWIYLLRYLQKRTFIV